MSELEQLADKWYEEYCYKNRRKQDVIKELEEVFSVSLRNSDSSADNNKVEQLHSDEELVSKIEDMALDLYNGNNSLDYFSEELKDLFKTHRNTVSTAVNQKDDNLVDEDELVSKIETMLFNLSTTMIDDYYGNEVIAISGKNKIAKEIAKLFKTYQNSVLRQDLNQVSKYSNRGETESKIAFKIKD